MGDYRRGGEGYEPPALIVLGSIGELTYGLKSQGPGDAGQSYCPTC
jgi:hypothetical protein